MFNSAMFNGQDSSVDRSVSNSDIFKTTSSKLNVLSLGSSYRSGDSHVSGLDSYETLEQTVNEARSRFAETKSVLEDLPDRHKPGRSVAKLAASKLVGDADQVTGISRREPLVARRSMANTANTIYGRLDFTDALNPTRYGAYKDDYVYRSQTGGRVQIDMSSSQFDTYLQVLNLSTGQVIAFDDDSGLGADAQITFTANSGASYLVRATSYAAYTTGAYSISARSISSPTPPPSGRFNNTYGYGLVDAASAVARAINTWRFANVADRGGNEWGSDMVNAPEVWARGITGRGVTVAVIDSGVDTNHSDLRQNIWVNTDEIAGDGIDNDRNGYIDDRHGWNFGTGQFNGNVAPGTTDPGQGHGTHVAGTIAASNNGVGMTGVAPDAKIMALRIGNVAGNQFTNPGNLAQAIRYAVDNGARVINMSLSWSNSSELQSAMAYAASRNVITVSAAGNSSLLSPGTPAHYATQYGLSVGAVDRNRAIASFSNRAGFDNRIQHVVAPGVNVYSTVPGNRYELSNGTSMATPHVAGVVALMLSANPNLSHDQVRQIITGTAVSSAASVATFALNSQPVSEQPSTPFPSLTLTETAITPVEITRTGASMSKQQNHLDIVMAQDDTNILDVFTNRYSDKERTSKQHVQAVNLDVLNGRKYALSDEPNDLLLSRSRQQRA